jgi:hypothetical protein
MRCHVQNDPNPTERRANWYSVKVVLLAKERHHRKGVKPLNLEKIWVPTFTGISTLAINQQNKMVNTLVLDGRSLVSIECATASPSSKGD